MDWIVGVALLLVGGIIGFFVARFISQRGAASGGSVAEQQSLKEVMFQQAATHLNQSREVISTLEEQCNLLKSQMNAYEELLRQDEASEDGERLSYFGDQATVYIRNQQKLPKQKRQASEYQPKDFPDQSSGLFDGSKNQQVVETKQ